MTYQKKPIIYSWYYHPLLLKYGWKLLRLYSTHIRQLLYDAKTAYYYYLLRDRRITLPTLPNKVVLMPTTYCNAACGFCNYRNLNDKKESMHLTTAKQIIDASKKGGITSLSFTPTVGEAFLDPTLFEKLEYAKKQGMAVSLYSNGTLLDETRIDRVLSLGIDEFLISLGDIKPELEAEIYRITPLLAKKKIERLLLLLKRIDETNSHLRVILGFRAKRRYKEIMHDLLADDSPWKPYYLKRLFIVEYLHAYDNWGGRIKENDLLGVQRLRKPVMLKKYPCSALYDMSFLPDGTARLCSCRFKDSLYDDLVIGKLDSLDFHTLAKNKRWTEIIQQFAQGNYPDVCKGCTFYAPQYPTTTTAQKMDEQALTERG